MWQKFAVKASRYAPLILENPLVLVEVLPIAVAVGAIALVIDALDE